MKAEIAHRSPLVLKVAVAPTEGRAESMCDAGAAQSFAVTSSDAAWKAQPGEAASPRQWLAAQPPTFRWGTLQRADGGGRCCRKPTSFAALGWVFGRACHRVSREIADGRPDIYDHWRNFGTDLDADHRVLAG